MAGLGWSECPAVESIPGKVSGAWVLKGTRKPVSAIFENLEAGASIDDIMEWFDGWTGIKSGPSSILPHAVSRSRPLTRPRTRVIFDQAMPVPIRACLVGHSVRTSAQQG
jgi:hypothetical protein